MSAVVDPPGEPPKADPEALTLRARPRPVTRVSRRVLIAAAATCSAAVLGAAIVALGPPRFRGDERQRELYSIDRKPAAEGLARLPRNYGDLKPAATAPLGPPLPGDVGPPLVQLEREMGVRPPLPAAPNLPFRPDPEADSERAERLRLLRQARQARESGLFFQAGGRRESAGAPARPTAGGADGLAPNSETGAALPQRVRLELDPDRDPNNQGRKLDFLDQRGERGINPHRLQDPVSPYQVMAGAAIAASLVTGINSDLPGLVLAHVTDNVYDTVTGRHLLIPQGTRLIGRYDSVIAFGQQRALVVWNRLVLPDGASIAIDNLPGTDASGYAGLEDEVDFHTWRLIKGVVLSTVLGVGTELSLGGNESDLVRALRESTQNNANRAGQRITDRNLNLQPTITIRPGWPLRVIVHKDLILRPYRG